MFVRAKSRILFSFGINSMQSYSQTEQSVPSQKLFPGTDLKSHATLTIVVWTLLGIGIFLRIFHYVDNRSFWIDEIYLNTSIIKMSFWELATQPLYYEQKAPLGYLWLVRLSVALFGKGEMALRLVSLLCGLAALPLFLLIVRRFLLPVGMVIAVGIIALASPLVYHSVEAKQYSMELFGTILCLYLYTRYSHKLTWSPLLQWGLWGAIIIWFSLSSIFILASIACTVSLKYIIRKQWTTVFRVVSVFILWLISFAINYALFTYKSAPRAWLMYWFDLRKSFMPLPPSSLTDVKWFLQKIYQLLEYPLGILWQFARDGYALQSGIKIFLVILTLTLCGLSITRLFRKDWQLLIVLVLPIFLTLLASGLKVYPFYERLTVFLAPLFALLIAQGCDEIGAFLPIRARNQFTGLVIMLLLAWPLWTSINQAINSKYFGGYKRQYYRDNLLYLNERYHPGDIVYVYWNTLPAYTFYKEAYNLKFKAIEGKDARFISHTYQEYLQNLESDKAALVGKKRVWYLYERTFLINIGEYDYQPAWYWALQPNSGNLFYKYITRSGVVISTKKANQHTISLLDLSRR